MSAIKICRENLKPLGVMAKFRNHLKFSGTDIYSKSLGILNSLTKLATQLNIFKHRNVIDALNFILSKYYTQRIKYLQHLSYEITFCPFHT